ncbi:MAG: FkbM family methyltransferase [Flammeovirgaceae bacterium]
MEGEFTHERRGHNDDAKLFAIPVVDMLQFQNIKTKAVLYLRRLLGANGIFVSSNVNKQNLREFFNLIKPTSTNKDLIRIGSDGDGGYLIPNDIENVDACFSPGVSSNSDFEFELANKGVPCYMADYSVEKPPLAHPLFNFQRKFLGSKSDDVFITLDDWVAEEAAKKRELILQMDIEGAEYEVILAAKKETLKQFRILVIEFHDMEYLLSRVGYKLILESFKKILTDFEIVHLHPNNIMRDKSLQFEEYEIPSAIEITFLRKDRILSKAPNKNFPHQLDKRNSEYFDDYILPECWYQVGR